jgi:hypothetical protein
VRLSAYIQPTSGDLVAVLINPTEQERRVAVTPEGTAYGGAVTAVYRTVQGESGERWRQMGSLPAGNEVVLPKQSVATVTFTRPRPQNP